jgi:hypothetical protein
VETIGMASFFGFKINQSTSTGALFRRDQRGMVAVFARSHDTRVFIEAEGDIGFKGQPRAFKDDFWTEFISHMKMLSLALFIF